MSTLRCLETELKWLELIRAIDQDLKQIRIRKESEASFAEAVRLADKRTLK